MTSESQPYRNRKPRWRAQARKDLKARRGALVLRWEIWNVKITALLDFPDYILEQSIRALPVARDRIWLTPGTARLLIALDKAAGGHPTVLKQEFKRCNVCKRPILGAEAGIYRAKLEAAQADEPVPCGDTCARDKEIRVWSTQCLTKGTILERK